MIFLQDYKNHKGGEHRDPKTLKRRTLLWDKSCKMSVLPKIGI